MRKKEILLSTIVTALLFSILAYYFDITYCLNDDVMLQSILAGSFSGKPSGMCVYLSQPLSAFLCFLYSINSSIPWLGWMFCGCYILSFFLILYRLLCIRKNNWERVLLMAICVSSFLAIFLRQYVMIHYTVVAAITGGCGIFLLMTKTTIKNKKWSNSSILPIILFVLCYCIRTKVFFMLVPFILCACSFSYCMEPTIKNAKQLITCTLITVGCVAICFGIGKLCYAEESWQQYLDYNEARTEVYDYIGIWSDAESKSYYNEMGFTNRDQLLYQSYDIMLDEFVGTVEGTQNLRQLADNPYVPSKQFSFLSKWKNAIWIYIDKSIHMGETTPFNYLSILLYLSLVILFVTRKRFRYFLPLILCFGARSVLFCYLYANGRYPERVTVSIYLIEFLLLMAMAFCVLSQEEKRTKLEYVFGSVWLLLLLVLTKAGITDTQKEYMEQNAVNTTDGVVYSYMEAHPENFYFLDVYATVNYTQKAVELVPVKTQNYLVLGGWMSGSPLVMDKMNYFMLNNPNSALQTGDNVYYIVKQETGLSVSDLEQILQLEAGTFILTDTLVSHEDCYAIYRVEE